MKVIVCHLNPDFDALASLALARLVYPGAVCVAPGQGDEETRAFQHLYRDWLELTPPSDVDLGEVSELIVVDTSDPARIAPFDTLIGRVPITLYDHHPRGEPAIPAARGVHRQVGATATLLTLLLESRQHPIPPELASFALLGIHEDTGDFCYGLTSSADHRAASHLLASGASLGLVRDFSRDRSSDVQRGLLTELLRGAQEHTLAGHTLVVATLESEDYIGGLAPLAQQLLELHGSEAALVVARMDGKTLVVARARAQSFDVGRALAEHLGGGGHPGAAFAQSPLSAADTVRKLLAVLPDYAIPLQSARALMSTPLRTIRADTSLADAQATLLRYGHNGAPVVDDSGALVGVISRRDLDRALRHGLGHVPVASFMTRKVITATEQSSERDLERLVQTHNIGRIPIVRQGEHGDELVGIVTRSDLLATRHPPKKPRDLAERILGPLPAAAKDALELVRQRFDGRDGGALYLVGGSVRDALLGAGIYDIDLVVEGDSAERLGSVLQRDTGGSLSCHLDFGTCTLTLKNGLDLDLATAREEFYDHPGALPDVTPSTLSKDLARRDFTVNALALRLEPLPLTFVDPFDGLRDLERRQLRTLHPLSFVEDVTRVIRGARLAGRLGFTLHPDSEAQARAALTPDLLAKISHSRLRNELMLTLGEPRVAPALAVLGDCGALQTMFGAHADQDVLRALDAQRQRTRIPDESYLIALLLGVPDDAVEAQARAYGWPKRVVQERRAVRAMQQEGRLEPSTFNNLSDAGRAVVKALSPEFRVQGERLEHTPQRRTLRGQDLLDMGLIPGPDVGAVLRQVTEARAAGDVETYEEERDLAERLIRNLDNDLDNPDSDRPDDTPGETAHRHESAS
ncbi:MAG: CBS domain-containing protein [Trueperaceae bacterium]|nr:CBS domain-containing protein [Trueperaceae bacterium]